MTQPVNLDNHECRKWRMVTDSRSLIARVLNLGTPNKCTDAEKHLCKSSSGGRQSGYAKFRRYSNRFVLRGGTDAPRCIILSLLLAIVRSASPPPTLSADQALQTTSISFPESAGDAGDGPGYCARFLYLLQCAEERPTPELSGGARAAVLQLVYRTAPRRTCGGGGGSAEPRPATDVVLPPAPDGSVEPVVRVWGDCGATGAPVPPPCALQRNPPFLPLSSLRNDVHSNNTGRCSRCSCRGR